MPRKVCVFTSTRADYGLLYWLLRAINEHDALELQLLVSGNHFASEFGNTYQQIESDGFVINEAVPITNNDDSTKGTLLSLAEGLKGYAKALEALEPDVFVLLGDRFETLGAAQAAFISKTPIVHIHGGEITEGAWDDAIRHAITKLSHVHCTAADEYARRVIQLGEPKDRVFNVGALGLEYASRSPMMSVTQLSDSLDKQLQKPFFILTYHPVTLAEEMPDNTLEQIFLAFKAFPQYQVIITYPNMDAGYKEVVSLIEAQAQENPSQFILCKSLGSQRFMSALNHASLMLGNSSSGIIEAPFFKTPTVNIGDRQKGRLSAESVFHCGATTTDISAAIDEALDWSTNVDKSTFKHPYGQGDSSAKILDLLVNGEFNVIKQFVDL